MSDLLEPSSDPSTRCTRRYPWLMDTLPPDPARMLEKWMAWERGETQPGKLVSELKTAGLPDLLRTLAAETPADAGA